MMGHFVSASMCDTVEFHPLIYMQVLILHLAGSHCITQPLGLSQHSDSLTVSFNPQGARTELTRFNWVNIMAADALAPCVARTSAAMILIM